MDPGFANLFRRSAYLCGSSRLSGDAASEDERQRIREERERFVAAAVAFCAKHDQSFAQCVWRAVCPGGDPDCRRPIGIEVEAKQWADVRMIFGDVVCVIEFKLGAALRDHQNPDKQAFKEPGGYGDFIRKDADRRGLKPRYVVFGWRNGTIKCRNILGIEIAQVSWMELANQLPSTKPYSSPLVDDLCSLLSGFGQWEFTMRKMKDAKLSNKLGSVGAAVEILESIRSSLSWPTTVRVETRTSPDHWELGIYLKASVRQKVVKGLAEALLRENQSKDTLAWFGYLAEAGAKAKRCVYVYCSKSRRDALVERLKDGSFAVDENPGRDKDGDEPCAIVIGGNEERDDIDWFTTLLETASKRHPVARK